MCDICGCPFVNPFTTLIAEHEALLDAAVRGDASRLASLWTSHREWERSALEELASRADLDDLLQAVARADAGTGELVASGALGAPVVRALQDHAGSYEWDLFPHLLFALGHDGLATAGRNHA